ncbi:MAG: serine protein kinase [Parcubacteria group bacterium Gr01-1014_48]|nr:MAG: serine protein kinase [Parcubacteria group bacterium Greene0416_14]TSC72949.1 MAG: serine protein kinase [Parcubacteria group bacterium Gr01-1014_48]TSC99748.1 MAG: serine protein kinase [Parcubacteria group bacterium Greene1014_15]TSD07697.1 MAG: serine protein kinase [Parcubacteria group bacterium Greene0714_4]
MDIFAKIDAHLQHHTMENWEGTFRDYLGLVIKQPSLAERAHARLYNMIKAAGVRVDDEGKEHYAFFERDLYGIDEPLARVVEYFKAAAMGSDVGRRILLLYGPPSSGKSQFVILLKHALEEYTQTVEGAVYALAECPQHEDPLNLLPHELRRDFQEETSIQIEGELCPLCALNLREKYKGDVYSVPVKRIFFSERERVGVGTFVPSDPKSQDISELVGSIDLSTIGNYGSESDPRAYRFDGELNIANRGLMEFIEMLKADERFLYVLLTLSQEKNIKTGRFPLIYADECVISHTNETEFNEFLANKKSEALHDRMIMIRIPYNLKVSQEERIYQKLLRQTSLQGMHLAPHTLRAAAIFAILSRLEEPKQAGLTLIKKLKLYDGEDVEGFRQKDIKLIREQTEREGMDGISPRFIINRISTSLIKPDTRCINPIDVLRAIKEGIDLQSQLKKADRERYNNLIADARREYDEIARNDVQKAFFVSFEQEAVTLLDNYLDNVEAHLDQKKLLDPITGEEVPANEKLMRSIEEKVQVPEHGKESFRNEIFRKVAMAHRRKEKFDYTTHEKLKQAIEKQLFEERRDTIKLTIASRSPEAEQLRKLNEVVETLVAREGYCTECANELLKYVSSLLAREK